MKPKQQSQGMSGEELVTELEDRNRRAIGYLSDEVSVTQDDNLERYLGEPYGDEEDGHSSAISMDVAEVCDWALPDMLEPFVSGDKAVEFEPMTEADEQWCEQADDLCAHVFWKDNPGFLTLHDTIKTGLIQRLGVIKTVWKDDEKVETQELTGLNVLGLQELMQDQTVTIDEQTAEPVPPVDAEAYPDGQSYNVAITRRTKAGTVSVRSVPPEQFKVTARTSDIEAADYVAHEQEVRRGELLDMGFDQDAVMRVVGNSKRDTDRQDVRFKDEERYEDTGQKKMSDIVTLYEEYPLIDFHGDGRLVRLQVFRVGKHLLDEPVEVSEHPFDTWSADRIPHRLIGLGLADKVKQTQYIKTHLTRGMLDNVYLANQPRVEVPETAMTAEGETIEDLLQYRIGGLIRTKQPGMLNPIVTPDRSATALGAITYMDQVREQQSGIVKNGMAISSETVDPKSATQARKEDRNEQVRKRLMCRMIAETLLVPVFRKILRNLVKYQDAARQIKVRDQWVEMSPSYWNADMRAGVAIGLGYANKDEEMAAATTMLGVQQELFAQGLATPKHVYNTVEKLVKALGWRHADKYALDPASPEGQQAMQARSEQQPDPKAMEAQAKIQLEQQKSQHQAQLKEQELQFRAREAQAKAAIDQQMAMIKADTDRQVAAIRIESERQIAEMRMLMEERLAIRKQDSEAELAEQRLTVQAATASHANGSSNSTGGVRFGGKIG